SFSGENWLYNTSTAAPAVKEIVASFNRSTDGSVAVTTLAFDTSESVLIDDEDASRGLLTRGVKVTVDNGTTTPTTMTYFLIDVSSTASASGTEIELTVSTSDDAIDGMISSVDVVLQQLTDSASTLGAITKRIEMQEEFVATL